MLLGRAPGGGAGWHEPRQDCPGPGGITPTRVVKRPEKTRLWAPRDARGTGFDTVVHVPVFSR